MPFNDNLPASGTKPWYTPFNTAWGNLKTFVNGLETQIANIQLIPGPKGDPGAKGDPGPKGDPGDGSTVTWDSLSGKPATFAPSAHTHAISEVNGLPAALDAKASALDLTNGLASKASAADLDNTFATATRAEGKADANATAIGTKANAADVVPTSRTVAGKPLSANVTLAKADVGLGSVDNTSDANKPVSTPQQTALNAKVNTSERATLNTLGYLHGAPISNNGTVPVGVLPYDIIVEAAP